MHRSLLRRLSPFTLATLALGALPTACAAPEAPSPSAASTHTASRALGSGACGPAEADVVRAVDDVRSLRVYLTERASDGEQRLAYAGDASLRSDGSVDLGGLPEGTGYKLEVFGEGASGTWYGMRPSVDIRANGGGVGANDCLRRHFSQGSVYTKRRHLYLRVYGAIQIGLRKYPRAVGAHQGDFV